MTPIPATSTNSTVLLLDLLDAYAALAWRAMLTEVNLPPKPGLVDCINNGTHKDMALEDFHHSAEAIQSWLPRLTEYGAFNAQLSPEDVLKGLHPLGMACEADMLRATAGVNIHRGSIFSLGLPCVAINRLHQLRLTVIAETICSTATTFCRDLTERKLRQNNQQLTVGQRPYQQLGSTGARGEAEVGYPLVIQHALSYYRALLTQGRDPELVLLDTLLLLMFTNGDANVAPRGGAEGLRQLQQQATTLMQQGGIRTPAGLEYLRQFDQQCIERNLSPGGRADLLTVTWFLAQISQIHHYHN